jgi:autotransporter-associated beta strand protein
MKQTQRQFLIFTLFLGSSPAIQAQTLYWNPNPLSDDWANTVWATTSGGTPSSTWTSGDNAVFDQSGTYTANINADQTAANINITAGAVTFDGTNTVASNNLNIGSGASLTADSDRFLKVGTTTLTIDGTLTQTAAVSLSTRRVAIAGGGGSIVLSGGFRTNGNFNFAGDISGTGSIITDGGGTFTLSGNNTYAGDTLIRHGNTVRVGSSTALSANSFLRFGGGTNIVELTGANFSREVGTSAGQVRFHAGSDGAGNSGFAAVNADRTVAINGTVVWGTTVANPSNSFNPGVFYLGTAASTHKVTLTTGINLNGANRVIQSNNGSAAVEGEISGVISGGAGSILTKQGTGVLLLSNANTHAGGTVIAQSQGAINPLRISHANALGSGSLTIGGGGNNDQARLELTGGITVSNTIVSLSSRGNSAPSILNISGNNTVSSNIGVGGGGSRTTLQSDSGKLTFSGNATTRTLLLTGDGDGEIQGTTTIGSGYGLEKSGNGIWTVNSGNLNNTTATVSDGTLLVNGTLANSAATVNGGTLGGTGSISGSVTINSTGTLSPGASIESLDTGALSFTTGASFLYELNTSSPDADLVNANGDLSFDGTVSLDLSDLGTAAALAFGTKFTLISYFGTWDGDTFDGYADDSTFVFSGNEWRIDYNDTSAGAVNGGLYSNAVTLTVIPEPAAALLGGLGLLALLRRRR